MPISQLDFYFPFIVFFYGFLICLMLESAWVQRKIIALESNIINGESANQVSLIIQAYKNMNERRKWAWFCVIVGGLWSLQNLWS